ncbi:MAG: hypothetical protein QOD60_2381 [Solirubrobacterales bacterium]|jgi:uncharacterized membrane protein YphA (DoxX/SURF4 family)|nr:hypothetical protein [Solirubrobacterales bacterium]
MDVVFLIGRILFASLFLLSGFGHFAKREMLVGYSKAAGTPIPEVGVPLAGAMIIAGAISIAFGIWADVGALLIVAFLIPTNYYMHAFWAIEDPMESQMQQTHFMKNTALLGGAIIIFWLFNTGQDLPLTVTNALFGRF